MSVLAERTIGICLIQVLADMIKTNNPAMSHCVGSVETGKWAIPTPPFKFAKAAIFDAILRGGSYSFKTDR